MIIPDARVVFEFVRARPGVTCAQIAGELDAPTINVSALLRKLRADGKLKSFGHTKATKWRPAPNWR